VLRVRTDRNETYRRRQEVVAVVGRSVREALG